MAERHELELYMTEPHVSVLGPGDRFVIWVQGCNRNCPGCIAESSHAAGDGFRMTPAALALEILLSGAEGITISGGEPFLQAEALADTVVRVRRKKDLGVIVYTGYLYEELSSVPGADRLLAVTDLLIDGPYVRELDDGLSLRGSSNQRVLPLTGRYLDALGLYGTEQRKAQHFLRGQELHIAGLPDGDYGHTASVPSCPNY